MRHRSSILLFYSSDDTEFIRRFPAKAITHGFTRRRPIRSLQIPLRMENIPRRKICEICEICGIKNFHEEKSASSVKSVGQKTSTKKNLRHLRNLWDKKLPRRKICVICEICVTKTIREYFGRQPLARGQISAKIRE